MKVTIIPFMIGASGTGTKGLLKQLENLKVGGRMNTENSSGDLRRLAVTQTPVKDHQLPLRWKTLIE